MTDREDLDDQIWRTFVGCGVTDDQTPRAASGKALAAMLRGNHRYVFSLIHQFNQPVTAPDSGRNHIIVEFASKVRRKHAALQDIRELVEARLAQTLAINPLPMDYSKKYP